MPPGCFDLWIRGPGQGSGEGVDCEPSLGSWAIRDTPLLYKPPFPGERPLKERPVWGSCLKGAGTRDGKGGVSRNAWGPHEGVITKLAPCFNETCGLCLHHCCHRTPCVQACKMQTRVCQPVDFGGFQSSEVAILLWMKLKSFLLNSEHAIRNLLQRGIF